LPYYITVTNKPSQGAEPFTGGELITEGNQHVIRARFADADFFVRDDRKHNLADFLPRLGTLIFQTRLGPMLDKSHRITSLVEVLSPILSLSQSETGIAHRTAELCKADLATKMVIEMTSLQGILGRYYAIASGESASVAEAIFEHYLPRFAGDLLPKPSGLVVGLADRLTRCRSVCCRHGTIWCAIHLPSAGCAGLVQALIGQNVSFDLRRAQSAASLLPSPWMRKPVCLPGVYYRAPA
jgi:glycyl-tRNA synthetase